MLNEAASSCSSSLFTFPKTMSACFSEAASNTGAKPLHGPDDPVFCRNKAQQRRLDLRCARKRVEAMPEHERHRQKRIVALCHFGDTVVRRHEYDAPQEAMRRQVNRYTAAQTAAHRDDA